MNYSARSKQIQWKQRPVGPGLEDIRKKFPRTLSPRTCSALLWEVLYVKRSPGKDSVTKVFFSFQEVWVKEHVKTQVFKRKVQSTLVYRWYRWFVCSHNKSFFPGRVWWEPSWSLYSNGRTSFASRSQEDRLGTVVSKPLPHNHRCCNLSNTNAEAGEVAQLIENLPQMHEDLSWIPVAMENL